MNNDTPRTDSVAGYPDEGGWWVENEKGPYVDVDFARDLERENARLRSVIGEVLSHRKEDRDGSHVMWVGEGTFMRCEAALGQHTNSAPRQ